MSSFLYCLDTAQFLLDKIMNIYFNCLRLDVQLFAKVLVFFFVSNSEDLIFFMFL